MKSSITALKFSVQLISLSMYNVARPVNCSCCGIVDRRYDFMSLDLETLLSAESAATGSVKTIIRTTLTIG
jgi:hypothetical protein